MDINVPSNVAIAGKITSIMSVWQVKLLGNRRHIPKFPHLIGRAEGNFFMVSRNPHRLLKHPKMGIDSVFLRSNND